MSSLASLIDAPIKTQTATVRINGNRVANILDVSVTSTINDTLTQATVTLASDPKANPEDKIQISLGYDKSEQLVFTGYLDDTNPNEFEPTWKLTARDVLKHMMDSYLVQEIKFGLDANTGLIYYSVYNGSVFEAFEYSDFSSLYAAHPETQGNITDQGIKTEALITWLLKMCGLTNIQVDATNFFVGDLNPVKFSLTSLYDAAMQVANLIGWRLYADAAGIVHFKKRPRNASGYTQWIYTDKGSPYNILKVSKTSTSSDLRNYVEIRGYSGIQYIARADSPYIKSSTYRGVLISNELIDTPGMATFMGNRVLKDLNRLKDTIDLEVGGNPLIYPGCSIKIKSKIAGGTFLVEDVQQSMNAQEYKMQIKASVFPGDTDFTEDTPDIVAAFVPIQLAALGDPKYMVEFDGSPSYSNRGQIVQWNWHWPNNTAFTANIPQAWYTFDSTEITAGASGIVSLTVTDSMGNTATTSSGITLESLIEATPVKYRQLYAALDTEGVGSLDAGLTWNTISVPAISVAASNFENGGAFTPSGYALFGTNDGRVVKTTDGCVTFYEVLSAAGTFDDVTIPELDGSYALAAQNNAGTGYLYRSNDSGETWTQISTFITPIKQCLFDYTNYNHLIVICSGIGRVFESFDNGGNWVQDNFGIDTNWNSNGSVTNYYAHTSGILSVNAGIATTVSGTSSNHVAITIKTDDDVGIMSVDITGQHWVYSGGMTQTQYNPTNTTQHMIRDGELPVVYYAVTSGIGKSLDFNYTMSGLYYPVESVYGKMVAYGPLAEPVLGKFYIIAAHVLGLGGSVNQGGGYDTGRGVFLAGKDNIHWYKVLDAPNIDMFATRPGLIAVLDNNVIHTLNIATSGTVGSGVVPIYNFYTPSSGNTLEAVWLSRIDSNMYAVTADATIERTEHTWAAPTTSQVNTTQHFAEDTDTAANVSYYSWTLGGAEDKAFWSYHRLITPAAASFKYYNANLLDGTYVLWQGSGPAPISQYIIQNFVHFPGTFATVVLNEDDGIFYALSGASVSSLSPLGITKDEVLVNIIGAEPNNSPTFIAGSQYWAIFDSAFNKTSIYYATMSGITRVTSYGLGAAEEIYTCASGHYLRNMWVAHDTFDLYDYITAWEVRPDQPSRVAASGIARELIVYSIDNGENFADGPDTPPIILGAAPTCVYVDAIKTVLL